MEKTSTCLSMTNENHSVKQIGIINITSMSPAQLLRLSERTGKFGGLIRIFIHPFYEEYSHTQCFIDHTENGSYPKISAIKDGIVRMLAQSPEETPPIFIFEELERLDQTITKVAKLNKTSGNEIYLVPTQCDSSEPKFNRDSVYEKRESNWAKFINLLHRVNVQRILIGGMRFTIAYINDPDDLNSKDRAFRDQLVRTGSTERNIELGRCVGNAIDNLAGEFEIEVSTLTHPHSRIDVINLTHNGLRQRYSTPNHTLLHILETGLSDTSLKENPFDRK